ncbi:MAG: hypothetical protein RJA36_3370 [Pseudomonadota bacterium]|jgi:diguanylate cyclase (GGDEF)-like protein/PAS domain S-box-containing protein
MARSGKPRATDAPARASDAALFERLPLPALELDAAGDVRRANDQARRLLGVVPQGQPLRGLLLGRLAADDRTRLLDAIACAEAQALQQRLEGLVLETGAGQSLRVDAWLQAAVDPDGPAACVLLQLLDRTRELEANRGRRLSEAVFLHSREAIFVTDDEGCIERINPAFERITGLPATAVQGRPAMFLFAQPGDGSPDQYREVLESLEQRGHWTGELASHDTLGKPLVWWANVAVVRDEGGVRRGYMAILTDLTEQRRSQDEISKLATTDSLTGLPNRALFLDRLQQAVSRAEREQQSFALLFADLDHFKAVNDTLGHAVGDELLVVIAHRLSDSVREMDTVARFGGDEFVMLLPNISREHAVELAARLLQYLREPMKLEGLPDYRAQASVGLVMYPEDGQDADALLRHADEAMYAAKRGGRNRLQVYSAELGASSQEVLNLHLELRRALEQGQLRVRLQPKFRLRDLAVVGAEALVRWQHPRLGLLGPGEFLAVAEQHQMLGEIDTWLLQTTLRHVDAWAARGRWPEGWTLSVNHSASDIQQPHWPSHLDQLLQGSRLQPRWLDIELSETVWARPTPEVLERLRQLKALGVSLTIDDFGTGYSSLSYLKHLPASGVKIDQSFVHGMLAHESDRVLVETITELARRLGLELVAEGIENEAQRSLLLEMGCQVGQGYFLSPPLTPEEFAARFLASC